jgi:curli biogenesis system outer membrane secretion channel CsgG
MARRFVVEACASAIFLLFAAGSGLAAPAEPDDPVGALGSPGGAPADGAAPMHAQTTSSLQLPSAPALTPVVMPTPPASFCTEIDRGKYLADVFNPSVDTSNANVAKANAHLEDLSRVIAATTAPLDLLAGHKAFDAYRPTADSAYRFGLDVLALRPAIMAAPIVSCAPREVQASAPPPTPPPMAPSAGSRPVARTAVALAADPPVERAALRGPRRTVAVGVINGSGGFEKSEDWQAGPALSAMLEKSLSQRPQVIVVERTQLDQVINEQMLSATHVTGGTSSSPAKMIPAQYLVVGAVTEFGAPNEGGGLSIGGFGGGGFGGALALKKETGKVSIDLRILNTRTSEVVKAFTVTKTVSRTGVSVTTDYRGLSVGSDAFSKTPLGEACRQALEEAAERIADLVSQSGWEAKVVEADGDDVFVNAGAEAGLVAGDRLRIEHIGHTLTDPDTGQVLSQNRETLGELVIEGAEPKVSHGHFTAAEPGATPQRGDLVTLEGQ